MVSEALWRSYKNYSGVLIPGDIKVALPENKLNHFQRAFYLTAQLESPKWGLVQSYDGAGISGGPFHFTAYQPASGVQGSLFSLLSCLVDELKDTNSNLNAVIHEIKNSGWLLINGKLYSLDKSKLISGEEIRNTLAPVNGKVPKSGNAWEQAVKWATLFHNLLSDPQTFPIQTKFSINYLINGQQIIEKVVYTHVLGDTQIDLRNVTVSVTLGKCSLQEPMDLALCVYHSHSVNAPGIAKSCLESALKVTDFSDFPRILIKLLGTNNYGNWHDTVDGKNRYDRTRIAAKTSGLWNKELFENSSIMPENFS